MFIVTAIPAFLDNYFWLLSADDLAVVVDPGDAAPVLRYLADHHLKLDAILITHHHPDHIGGISALRQQYPVPVYGPRAETGKISGLTELLDDGDLVHVLDQTLTVMSLPGHTLGHIGYYQTGVNPLIFCGDTLFSGGCGRLFEGTPQQMHNSLARIAALPDATKIYCTHEYTLSNLAFAQAVEPGNPDIVGHIEKVKALRACQQPSLPSTLALERRINPFLRTGRREVVAAIQAQTGNLSADTVQTFAAMRRWKDSFKAACPL